MKDKQCLFCKIIKKEIPSKILYKTKRLITILDAFPISKGHCLIISNFHYKNIENVNYETWQEIHQHLQHSIKTISKAFAPGGFNILNNMNKIAKQMVFHFHLHIIPKYTENDGLITKSNLQSQLNLVKIYQILQQTEN